MLHACVGATALHNADETLLLLPMAKAFLSSQERPVS
jgi:hypothetical protein